MCVCSVVPSVLAAITVPMFLCNPRKLCLICTVYIMDFNDFNIVGDSQHCIDMGGNITCNVLDPDNLKPLNDIYNYSLLHLKV